MNTTCVLPLCLLAGCATGDFVDRNAATSDLRAASPAPFRVAVAPLQVVPELDLAKATALGGELTAQRLHDALLADLRTLRAASVVTAVGGDDLAEAEAAGADLLLRPKLVGADFQFQGGSTDGLLSSLLWLTTWVGGLFIADSDYLAGLEIDWQIVNPHNGQAIADLGGTVRTVRLGFFDRNDVASLGTLQSLLIPPPLTADGDAATARSLTAAAVAHAAGELTGYLKSGLAGDERELLGELRVEAPVNGGVVADAFTLRGALVAHELIGELAVLVDDTVAVELDATGLPPRSQQQVGARTFRVPLPELQLTAHPGANRIVVEYVAGGRRSSRTIVCYGSDQGGGS